MLGELAKHRAETALPGYWPTLETSARQWAAAQSASDFWKAAKDAQPQWIKEYADATGDALFDSAGLPDFVGKGWLRTREKAFARSRGTGGIAKVFLADGPPVPRLNDLVRTRVQTQYLDGVPFVCEKLVALALRYNIKIDRHTESRHTGYYAEHMYFETEMPFQFIESGFVSVKCEIQLATRLSSTIWTATHGAYEDARRQSDSHAGWQWDPAGSRFIAAQLAHMIHLADGLLIQLREAQRAEKGRKK